MLCLVAANKDGVPGANKENAMHNPAYNISAALTYATQLVNVLAYYVNIKLPYKLTCGYVLRIIYTTCKHIYEMIFFISCLFLLGVDNVRTHINNKLCEIFSLSWSCFFREFCGNELSDQKFARKVARLNSNILHLCLTQNTKIEVLNPMHTLQNLMHLLNTEISDLGR